MKEEKAMEEKIGKETINSRKNSFTERLKTLKTKAKALMAHNCKGCAKKEDAVRKVAAMGGKAVVGLGTGVCLGVGVLVAAGVAEVAIPALLVFEVLAVTGGALGLVKGAKDLKK